MRVATYIILLLCLMTNLGSLDVEMAEPIAARSQPQIEQDIQELVFRKLFASFATEIKERKLIFIGFTTKPEFPSAKFLQRFTGHTPPVKSSKDAKETDFGMIDKQTGEKGLFFTVGEIEWLGEESANVYCGYYKAPLHAAGLLASIRKVNGNWEVRHLSIRAIS